MDPGRCSGHAAPTSQRRAHQLRHGNLPRRLARHRPEATWRAVGSILSDPGRRTNTTGSNRVKWLGSGLYVCGVCGQPALRVSQTGNHRLPAYRCKARDNTRQSGHVTRAAQYLDDYIERIIMARLQQPDATDLFTAPTGMDLDTTALHTEAAAIAQRSPTCPPISTPPESTSTGKHTDHPPPCMERFFPTIAAR
jgi:recombinase-like zinc beta ribbon protein